MAWPIGPGGPLVLRRSLIGQLVVYERHTPVAVWQLGVPESVALRWCCRRAGWL